MYNQQNSYTSTNTGSFGQNVSSQYRGFQRSFQPTGQVQSAYGQGGYSQSAFPSSSFGGQSTESFHTANYRGNQQGHDQSLRGDASSPQQSAYSGRTSFTAGVLGSNQQGYGSSNYGSSVGSGSWGAGSSFQNTTAQYGGMGGSMSTEAFHSANYRGNQPGHDQSLRADSFSPSQQGGSAYAGRTGYGASSYGMSSMGSTGSMSSVGMGSFGSSNQGANQGSMSTESFHTANYRGNQQGHDQSLRGDSSSPQQSAYDGRTSFTAGVLGAGSQGNGYSGRF